jgi:TP901 family phage tail tape measure protein
MNLEKLLFTVDLHDGVTGPVGKMQKKLDLFATDARKSFMQVGTGAAGMYAAGAGIHAMLSPAREMNKALSEVASLDVDDSALKKLSNQGLLYSIKFGESADAFASSAYDIQSSISGLTGNELASFTNASNVLAKATKADSATITNYAGTMYGIFKNEANQIGKAKWIEQLTGQTATAVQMFKTNGMEMSGAFTSLGASATSAGINAAEQMAVLGTLQSTMSGSEAGTKYKAFLSGVGGAQDKLGLKFTDSNGKMLGMMDILTKLKGKFGDTLDVAESDALKSAFGSDEAVGMIKLLMADTKGLGDSINKLGDVKGMKKAEQMAAKMVDPFDRLSAGGRALTIVLGQALLPAINPIIDGFANLSEKMVGWADKFPNITRWIGYGAAAILGFTGVLGAASAASGILRIATFGLSGSLGALNLILGPAKTAITFTKLAWQAYSGSQWLANAALWGFPATWIVGALIGVGAAIGAVVYWWDDLTTAFTDSSWGQALMGIFNSVIGWFKGLGGAVDWLVDKLDFLPGVDVSSETKITHTADATSALPAGLDATAQNAALHGSGGMAVSSQAAIPSAPTAEVLKTSPVLEASRRPATPQGSTMQTISSTLSKDQSHSQHIGKVVINTEGKQDAASIREQLIMVGA